ncbi:unnamed protein product [Moneuplotes crassus]|uniref:Uncharacterized protein n=1 Tax=Euplotes crassus TaxID=5936 RepID=A0AAD2CY37_EUPCR|nr:unnamed protein product [Moneuplotes crassus]
MEFLKDKIDSFKQSLDGLHEKNPQLVYTFAAIGLGYVALKVAKDLRGVYQYVLRPARDLKQRYGNEWCVITGASDGIGKGFAFELVKKGMKVVLVGRNQDKLDTVKQQIEDTYEGAQLKTVQFDFNQQYTEEVIKGLTEKFEEIEKCSILINNVGYAEASKFGLMKDADVHNMINVNITSNTVMAKIFIPKLLANDKRGGMINIGSSSCSQPFPNLSVYSASKSYIRQFSNSIHEEYKDKIDILICNTSSVKSQMNSGRYVGTITPEQHAQGVLDKLGHDRETSGHYIHGIYHYYSVRPIEGWVLKYINFKRHQDFMKEREIATKAEQEVKADEEIKKEE